MAYLPNIYRLTHVETGEIFEGTANDLAKKLNVAPTTIQKAYTDGRVTKTGYSVEMLGKVESVNKKWIHSSVLAEWDEFMAGVRKKYGKKRA